MAAPSSRILTTCRLFERLLLSGSPSASSRFHSTHSQAPGIDVPKKCFLAGGPPVLSSKCPSACGSVASHVSVPRRHVTWYTDKKISGNLGAVGVAKVDPDFTPITDKTEGQELAQKVNSSLERGEEGRLFAVVSIQGRHRKVTVEDILVIASEFPPTVGDRIRLEKVLMVGGKDFSLFGQPLLSREQVHVEATVIEKTLSHNQVWSTYKRRKRYRRMKLFRIPHTMIVINRIELDAVPRGLTPVTL